MLTNEEVKQLTEFSDKMQKIIESIGESKVDSRDIALAAVAKWVINYEQVTHGHDPID
jgi:hypothetical protein